MTTLPCNQCPQSAHGIGEDGLLYCLTHKADTREGLLLDFVFGIQAPTDGPVQR